MGNDANVIDNTPNSDDSPAQTPTELCLWFLLPGMAQGYAFYQLSNYFQDFLGWNILIPILWFVITAPAAHFLISTSRHRLSALITAVIVAGVCSLLAWWQSVQLGFDGSNPEESSVFVASAMFCTAVIAAAILPFYRTVVTGKRFNDYPSLFKFSWNQVVSALVALFFTLAVFAIMALSSALFNLIGIDIDEWLWRDDVRWVILSGAFALGIGICRTRDSIVNGVRYLIISLMRALLPIFVLVTGAFVVITAATGLSSITEKLSVTAVMLSSIALALTLCSAAVGDAKTITSRWLSVLCRLLAFLLVALCLLAAWALWQRVSQHGLTDERVLAMVLIAVASLYAVGYCMAALSRNLAGIVQQTNIIMILICGVVAMLLQTPLLLPQSIAAKNQLLRFQSGAVSAENLDLGWFKFKAGLPGDRVLDTIRKMPQSDIEPLQARLQKLDSIESYWKYKNDADSVEARTALQSLNEAVFIVHRAEQDPDDDLQRHDLAAWMGQQIDYGEWKKCSLESSTCVLTESDVFAEWDREYLLIIRSSATELRLHWVVEDSSGFRRLNDAFLYMPDTAESQIIASEKDIDSLVASAKNGNLPLGTIEIPAVKLGDQLINPYR